MKRLNGLERGRVYDIRYRCNLDRETIEDEIDEDERKGAEEGEEASE